MSDLVLETDWVRTYPTLQTRPALVAAMRADKGLRARVFHQANAIRVIAAQIRDPRVALEVLDAYWSRRRLLMEREREVYDHPGDHDVWNELVGWWKNEHKMAIGRIGGTPPQAGPYDVADPNLPSTPNPGSESSGVGEGA